MNNDEQRESIFSLKKLIEKRIEELKSEIAQSKVNHYGSFLRPSPVQVLVLIGRLREAQWIISQMDVIEAEISEGEEPEVEISRGVVR